MSAVAGGQAFEQGDFEAVWQAFSRQRKNEMSQGGIDEGGARRAQREAMIRTGISCFISNKA